MKTQSILSLAYRVIKLNEGLLKKLKQGAEPSTLNKDFDLMFMLTHRLRLEIQTKVNEACIKSGTTAAYNPVPNVG